MSEFLDGFLLGGKGVEPHQRVGQLFMPAVFLHDTEQEIRRMEALISECWIGAVCIFHSRASVATNFEGRKKVPDDGNSLERLRELMHRYRLAAQLPLLVAIDAEWGLAMRIENSRRYPHAITLGALQDEGLIREVGRSIGLDCNQNHIQWNLAPVVDINNDPDNPVIGYRAFGDQREAVYSKSRAFLEGMAAAGTLHALKHFPGHGDTAVDSHLGLPVIDKSLEELRETELYPFQKHIDQGTDAIMVGHLSLPQLDPSRPTTTSHKIVTGLLREQMGFQGIIISDALNMKAVSGNYPQKGQLELEAFKAGIDVLCFSEHPREGIEAIVKNGDSQRIDESFQRVWNLKRKAAANLGRPDRVTDGDFDNLQRRLAQGSLTERYGNPVLAQGVRKGDFLNLALGQPGNNLFSQGLELAYGKEALDLGADREKAKALMDSKENLVLAIFPPWAKPVDRFGFDPGTLDLVRQWVAQKNVLIYHFGNPYALDLLGLSPHTNLVLAYQDFPAFQQVALEHFKGNHRAVGQLPVNLKNFNA